MKKSLSILIAASLLMSVFTGCNANKKNDDLTGNQNNTVAAKDYISEPGVFPITTKPIELKVVVSDEAYIGELSKNDFYKWYEEKTNVKINFLEVAPAAMKERVNLMLASEDYPDVFMGAGITMDQEVQYGSLGVFKPLNKLIDKYGVETKKVFEENSKILPSAITTLDDNIYALPNINDSYHSTYNTRMWINQEWLTKLNLKTPTTTAEFKEVLTAFKTKDPNGNGKADEVALMGIKDSGHKNVNSFLLNSFLYTSSDFGLYIDKGVVKCTATQPEYKEGLRYIADLVKSGLIDPTSYTQTAEQLKQFAMDKNAVKLGAFPHQNVTDVLGQYGATADNRTTKYVPLAPLKGPNGYQGTIVSSSPIKNGFFVITKACKEPEIAFKWADGLYSQEATLASQIGLPGAGRRDCATGEKGIDGQQALYETLTVPQGVENNWRAQNVTLANRSSKFRLSQFVNDKDPNYMFSNNEVRLYNAAKNYYAPYAKTENNIPSFYWKEAEATEFAQISASLNTYILEQMVLFSLGTRNIDKDWDNYIKEFDNLKLKRAIELTQGAYDRQYKNKK